MASNAPMTIYREETVQAFEQHQSFLRLAVTTEHMMKGNIATFLVAGSGNATPVTRGLDGKIPGRSPDLTQLQATLVEWHDKEVRTDFNVFESQGDARRIAQLNTVGTINRKIDEDIIAGLEAATVQTNSGAAATADLSMVLTAQTTLGNADVSIEDEDNMFAFITPAFRSFLMQTTEFSSGDYVEMKQFSGPSRRFWRWNGVNWIVSSRITGTGTSSSTCFMFHRSAMGHAIAEGHPKVNAGFNGEEQYHWNISTTFMGAKLLQNSGVVEMIHNDSALSI